VAWSAAELGRAGIRLWLGHPSGCCAWTWDAGRRLLEVLFRVLRVQSFYSMEQTEREAVFAVEERLGAELAQSLTGDDVILVAA